MARSKNKNVGLIGLGIIGSRVAAALRKRGFQVFVWNRTPRPEQNFVGSPAEVAELCDVVQIFVSDDEALLAIVRELAPGLKAQNIVTAHCTVAPESMRVAAEIVERRGAKFLEAPFTGSKVAAGKGELVYYLGGDEATLNRARPILEASSKDMIVIGKIGDASVMKVATNLVTAATAQVAAESLALVRKAGIAPELFARAMKSNASNSSTLEMKLPLILAGDFETHFSVKHMLKDVRIGTKLARQFSLELPVTEVSGEMLLAEMKNGRGDADYSSIAQRYFPAAEKVVRPEPEKRIAESKPVEVSINKNSGESSVSEARPEIETKDEVPEGTNLSGGFRSWLSRRVSPLRARVLMRVFDLSTRAKFRLTGSDRVRFLNGQVTNDVRKANANFSMPACVLSAKGKLDAVIFIAADADEIFIDGEGEQRETLATRLERYIIADDVTMEDVSDKFSLFHVIAEATPTLPNDAPWRRAKRFGLTGWDLVIAAEEGERVRQMLAADYSLGEAAAAEELRIEQGIPRWGRELSGEIIPVEANLAEETVDYAKGCYIGQEVISRMKMSGQTNKRLCGLIAPNDSAFSTAMHLFNPEDDKEVGWVTSATRSDRLGKEIALGFVKRGFNEPGTELAARAPNESAHQVKVVALPFL